MNLINYMKIIILKRIKFIILRNIIRLLWIWVVLFCIIYYNEMVIDNLNNVKNVIVVYYVMIFEKCWLLF